MWLINVIDVDNISFGIFFDLAKVFDTVDHSILLEKPENFGLGGTQVFGLKVSFIGRWQCAYY